VRPANPNGISGLISIGAPGKPGSSGVALFRNSDVRKALGLTDDQIRQLGEVRARIQQEYESQLAKTGTLADNKREELLQDLRMIQQEDFFGAAASILTPQQLRRYRQLDYQYQGPGAFSNPEVRQHIQISADQLQRIQDLQKQNMYAFANLLQDSRGHHDEALARYNMYRRKLADRISDVLTTEQLRKWKSLTGEPFNFRYSFGSAITAANNW